MSKLTETEKEDIRFKVDCEGFDYYFTCYDSPDKVEDPEYKRLWLAYMKAHTELSNFLGIEYE